MYEEIIIVNQITYPYCTIINKSYKAHIVHLADEAVPYLLRMPYKI